MLLKELFESTDHINKIVVSTFDRESVIKAWGEKNGINSKKSLDSLAKMAAWHGAAASELIGKDVGNVMAGEKILNRSQLLKLVADLKKTLNSAEKENLTSEDGTRIILTVTDANEIDSLKEKVKAWNKEKKQDKLKLQVFNRPPNKEQAEAYFKVYIDGSPNALKPFRK